MAVTIEKRPIGVILDTCVTATINQDYNSVYATVNYTSHGLTDGDWVYIQSNVENYNGFWQVEVTNANEFILIDNPYVEWIVDAIITYCPQSTTHGWSCIHLPIVYELSNTRYPTNSVDPVRTISSITDDNGYLNLNLSGPLGTFEDLAFVKLSNCPDSDFDGIYQIIDKLSTSAVTINMAYSSATASGIVGASINIIYTNYVMVVRVYAGINSAHTWADQKPYELAATLEITPDENNRAKFSINEILKGFIETSNNLLQPSLPNNLDAWCMFFIEVGEQYDTSDGYTVTTFEGGFASDQSEFEGYAANAKLPFKNIHSGYLSEYVMTNSTAKFLTLFSIPVLFSCGDTPNCYQDISFILPQGYPNAFLKKEYYTNGVLQTTVNTEVVNSLHGGLFRLQLEDQNCNYDRVDATIISTDVNLLNEYGDAVQESTPNVAWTEDGIFGTPSVILTSNQTSEKVGFAYTFYKGRSYEINPSFQRISAGGTNNETIYIRFYSGKTLNLFSGLIQEFSGTYASFDNFTFTPSEDAAYIVYSIERPAGAGSYEYTLLTTVIEGVAISETKQFDIDCGCSNQEIRLTWLNYLGGFDYWAFHGESEHAIDITASGETTANIFPSWPKSYGEMADTIKKQTFRESANRKFIFSQHLTQAQADAIAYIKTSPLVQIVNSRQDRLTVLVDTDSFTKYKDGDKTYSISFNIMYTDNIPSQTV